LALAVVVGRELIKEIICNPEKSFAERRGCVLHSPKIGLFDIWPGFERVFSRGGRAESS
jgi:hypothetical protein